MAVEWFNNLFERKRQENKKRQQDMAYNKKEKEIRRQNEEIDQLLDSNLERLESLVDGVKKARDGN